MFVFSNLAVTLDGKIAPKGGGFYPLGTPEDRIQMGELRKQADAILVGGSTLRTHPKPMLPSLKRPGFKPYNVILTQKVENLPLDSPFFKSRQIRRILFVLNPPKKTPLSLLRGTTLLPLQKGSLPIAEQICNALSKLGIRSLLVEGGGQVMWHFVEQNLIDEYHLTLTPKILGGLSAPSLVAGEGFLPGAELQLKLKQCKILRDELYLTYAKVK